MTALPVFASIPLAVVGFGRMIAFLTAFFEVIADAQRQAAAAHKRYPFAEW